MAKIPSAVNRVLDIMLLFNDTAPELSIEEISHRIELPRSTAYRYIAILCEKGILEKRRSGVFRPGPYLLLLSQTASKQRELAQLALPYLKAVSEATGETVLLTQIAGNRSICVERVEALHNMRISFEIGQSQPLHAGASSKILLAYLDEAQRDRYISKPLERFTEYTPVDIDRLNDDLRQIREQGYCITDSEVDIGAKAAAVPIFNRKKHILAALSTAGPSFRMDDHVIEDHLRVLQAQAKRLNDTLIAHGY